MPCYYPLPAFQTEAGDIVFVERGKIRRSLILPCGRCIGCKLERSRQWAVRCMHEASMHEFNSFVNLTYKPEKCPISLDYRDFQLFMKRLRKKLSCFDVTLWSWTPRFYVAGEYGDEHHRPHFHACIFGVFFPDRYLWRKSRSGHMLYRSPLLEELWTLGSAEIGDVTFESAAYVARYITKKISGNAASEHYRFVDGDSGEIIDVSPEFSHMSLKPAIGSTWFARYKAEVFPLDRVVVRGKDQKPPKYYKTLLDRLPGTMSDDVEYARYLKSLDIPAEAKTEASLRAGEICAKARFRKGV